MGDRSDMLDIAEAKGAFQRGSLKILGPKPYALNHNTPNAEALNPKP